MKLKKLIFRHCRARLIRQFGNAKLVKHPNGEHELVGGSEADQKEAFEWASLFAHEIVFTRFHHRNSDHSLLGMSRFHAV